MTPRHRYQLAFFALGWLLLIAILAHGRFGESIRDAYSSVAQSMERVGQRISDAEGDARQRAAGRVSRAEEVRSQSPGFEAPGNLRNPSAMIFGAYDGRLPHSFSGLEELEAAVDHRFEIISIYQAWGDRPDQSGFPLRLVETIDRLGSVPMITWEPWVRDFDGKARPNLPPLAEREYASLAAVARGDYDFHVTRWAASAARYGKPVLLRFAHEMNDPYRYPWGPQNGNRPDDFIAAWKHVHLVFQKMGATNVIWVWSPHISMPWFEYYYPGDEWVDWVGTGVLNYGDVAPWSRWWTFHQILEKAYPALVEIGKPVMITEFGSLASGGDPADWYRQAFDDMEQKYPAIRSVVFFNQGSDVTLSTSPLNWTVTQDAAATQVVREALARVR